MAKKKMTRIDELYAADIDYSMPIDRFARNAKALLNKMKRGSCDAAEYGDGSARIYLNTAIDSKLVAKFDKEVRKLAAENKELTKLQLPVVNLELMSYEIGINFC